MDPRKIDDLLDKEENEFMELVQSADQVVETLLYLDDLLKDAGQ